MNKPCKHHCLQGLFKLKSYGACAVFFLQDKIQISWNNGGNSENSQQQPDIGQDKLQGNQWSNNSPLSVDDAFGVLASTVTINNAVWEYYDTMVINGESYFAFAGYDNYGAMGETLIVVNEKNGELYCYDPSGNLSDYSEYEKSVQDGLIESGNINGAGFANVAESIKLVDGQTVLNGLYMGMGLDESVRQVMANNHVATTKTTEEIRQALSAYQAADGNGDLLGFGKQTMFEMPCKIKLNYSSGQNDDGIWSGSPYLEELRVLFNANINNMKNLQNLDLDEQIKDKFISVLGQPTKTFLANENATEDSSDWVKLDTSVTYQWELENEVVNLYYMLWIDSEDELEGFEEGNVLYAIFVKSKAYIDKQNELASED